ncbi:phospholipase D family protein [Halomonas garicola]|uniref:phospholipase D family protein n=1 Tax=Halomonas garicola TaxID=1690008 RepID=UPI00289962C6|nr:phospholipase D family protein [Halomonas garicola]
MIFSSPVIFRLSALLAAVMLLGGCALPPPGPRPASQLLSVQQAADTRLGRALSQRLADRPEGVSGVYPLAEPLNAFSARALLAEGADKTLDVQYYIWADDTIGRLLFRTLHDAAERGVRVRLLLDDNGIAGLDESLAALDAHRNIEIRLFNPFPIRTPKWLGYLWDFPRLNRRMHSKSFTVDGQATIIGGRNVADEYFGANPQSRFADLDVLALGPAAREVNQEFDRYWASAPAYPVKKLLPEVQDPEAVLDELLEPSDNAGRYRDALEQSDFLERLLDESLEMTWAQVDVISDDPEKVLGDVHKDRLMSRQLAAALDDPRSSVTLVSPYFIPGDAGVDLFAELEARGVDVTVLTNSLAANDVALVHSGYAKYRRALLDAGVTLFETRRAATGGGKQPRAGVMSSAASSLHAKTFAVDGEVLFIGSLNFDPRSTHLNTEIGFLIESPELAADMESAFDNEVPQNAYQVMLEDGELRWQETRDGEPVTHHREPETGFFKRFWVKIFSLLPLEPLL